MTITMWEAVWSMFADKYTVGFQGMPLEKVKSDTQGCLDQLLSGYIVPDGEDPDILALSAMAGLKRMLEEWPTFPHMRAIWCGARDAIDRGKHYAKTPERMAQES